MNTSILNQYKYLAKQGDGALAFNGSVPCYLPSKANGCYESENGSLVFYGKCVQNGTPSPSSPVAVEYVDGDGRIGVQQLVQNGNFVDASGWGARSSGSIVVSSGEATYTVTAIDSAIYCMYHAVDVKVGHKYFCSIFAKKPSSNSPLSLRFSANSVGGGSEGGRCDVVAESTTEFSRSTAIVNSTIDALTVAIGFKNRLAVSLGDTFTVKNLLLVDITAMYGAGNEPSTVEQFKQMYPDDYYAYMYGTTITMPDLYGIGDIRDTYEPCVWVNGALRSRLTRRIGVVDLGTLDWVYTGIGSQGLYIFRVSNGIPNMYYGVKGATSNVGNILCSMYSASSYAKISGTSRLDYIMARYHTGQDYLFFYVNNKDYTDAASFKAAMSGVLLYYELASPVITLGDPQPVQSYGGATNIFHTSVVQPKIAATVVTHS